MSTSRARATPAALRGDLTDKLTTNADERPPTLARPRRQIAHHLRADRLRRKEELADVGPGGREVQIAVPAADTSRMDSGRRTAGALVHLLAGGKMVLTTDRAPAGGARP